MKKHEARRVYLKSIEQVIPYNQIAHRNKDLLKYHELSRDRKFDNGISGKVKSGNSKGVNKT